MRILMATTYIYEKQWPEFTRNKTGFGMMVRDIYQSISEDEEVYLISHVLTIGHEKSVLKHTISDVLRSAKLSDWIQGILWACKFNQPIKGRIQYFYYCLNKGYVRKVIKNLKPDVVHIHGLGQSTKTYMEVCEELHVPYVVTLHGLIGLNDTVTATNCDKTYEKLFLIKADQEDIPVTVISTGMKKRIEANYLHHEAKNISVVTNGIRLNPNKFRQDKRIEDDLYRQILSCKKEEKKIIYYVGNISKNKNQIQLVRVMKLVLAVNPDVIAVLFGQECDGGFTKGLIHKEQLENNIIIAGFCKEMYKFWPLADLNVLLSLCEGFGLSIIEGYNFGIPSVIIKDFDAVEDIYSKDAMMLCGNRNDDVIANVLLKALTVQWNKDAIVNLSKKYDLRNIAERYNECYRRCLEKRKDYGM
jgi:glycosyltransferase involved in cell wall biosynthesis